MVATSIGSDFKTRQLTYRSWIPYDYSSLLLFTVTYIYQATSLSVCTFYNIGADSLFSSLLIHIYCQFEILGHRLKSITKEGKVSAKLCANHHNQIYQLATKVNEEYKMIILIQFLTSTSMMCIELYQLTQREVDSKYIVSVIYTSCALMQILYYCWYGNEVQLKSLEVSDMVMECNLESLDNNSKKILLMIMKRAVYPVEFTSLYIVDVNLASFMALLKLSYSAFNLLKQDKE
ncbi:odorant receptor 46a-like [Hylaeus anthracinus]|uniref:odorant receptor 46a-like n=1 Tax=Hylaeus anthracinus TaxID=313031 RepID=UPI0023BA20DF|nr:odorant receptor 46a-like [Hylaeus anthracinus]XP_053998023.1 odorant receptor 46a-like [Hylaeus anthracinus]